MKKILLISTLFASAFLSSCDHEHFYPGLEEAALPVNKTAVVYKIMDTDYATVSSSKSNIAMLDKTAATYKADSTALASIGKNKYFADAAQAQKYLPALCSAKWFSASEGSSVKLTYMRTNQSASLLTMASLTYTVTDADYAAVWGVATTKCFTAKNSAVNNLPTILATALPTAAKNNVILVTYNESSSEPTAAVPNPKSSVVSSLYLYNGTKWTFYASKVEQYQLTADDYKAMGNTYGNFQGVQQDSYLPLFLKSKYPYAQEGDIKSTVYYYNSNPKTYRADVYKMVAGSWMKLNTSQEEATDQFVFSNGVWKYNPSVAIDLKPIKGAVDVSAFYQSMVDYVGKTYGTGYYQKGYTNAEFYYGASAFNNNFSFRINDWRNGCTDGATAYASYNDDALTALMNKRICEAFLPVLEKNYPDAMTIDGLNVTYTINFGIFTGTPIADCTHTIVYKVVGKGKFEYVKDSFKEIKK